MLKANTRLITTTDQLAEIADDLLNSKYLAVDCETTGLGRFAKVIGVSLATSPTTAYYIPITLYKPDSGLFSPWTEDARTYIQNVLIEVFTTSKRLLTHNGAFDAKVINNTFGVDIIPFIFADTALLHHTAINEAPPHGLKALAIKHLDPEADNPQDDLKKSITDNGGRWTKDEKDFYKADWKILGTYACFDVIYTFGLFEKFYPELLKSEKLVELWDKEVMPLLAVTYDLNTVGIKVDVPYFENLKVQMQDKIKTLEDEVYAMLGDKVKNYEFNKVKEAVSITERSMFGKFLKVNELWPWDETSDKHRAALLHWYNKKYQGERIFNLDSGNDKAFLLYDVLGLPVKQMTESGKRSTSKSTLDQLAEEFEDSSIILKLIQARSKELKLLSTYVEPILESNTFGRIYPSFNQTGTTSGRYSCGGNSLNLQTLPRDDHRIKAGFIPDEGKAFVGMDYSSLEPRTFSFISGEKVLIDTMKKGLDFYSSMAIRIFGMTDVSADPSADNYLGKIDKEKRQWIKPLCFTKDTILETRAGFKYIQDVLVGDEVRTHFGFYKVKNTFKRHSDTIKFITSRGNLNVTPEHPIWHEASNSFKRADEFNVNDVITSKRPEFVEFSKNNPALPVRASASFANNYEKSLLTLDFNSDWAWILGAFLGDGVGAYKNRAAKARAGFNSHLISSYIGICGLEIDEVADSFCKELGKYGFRLSLKRRMSKTSGNFLTYSCSDFELTKIFQDTFQAFIPKNDNNLHGHKNLRVPLFILNSPKEHRLAFLAGVLDTDGYAKTSKNRTEIQICTKSLDFASDLMVLLNSLGAKSGLQCSYNKTYKRDYYIIRINTAAVKILYDDGLHKFMRCRRKARSVAAVAPKPGFTPFDKPGRLIKKEMHIQVEVYDIEVDTVHEFYANTIRVHNCLSIPYGAGPGRLSQMMKIDYEEAKEIYDKYISAFPSLKKWMDLSDLQMKMNGYVESIVGRRKRSKTIHKLYTKYNVRNFSKYNLESVLRKLKEIDGIIDPVILYLECRNSMNVAKNHQIQSLAASICNQAMIDFKRKTLEIGLSADICLTVHDEIVVSCNKKDAEEVAQLLKSCMLHNRVTELMDMPLDGTPIITDKSLADAK